MDVMGWSTVAMKQRYMHVTKGCGGLSQTSSAVTSGKRTETLTFTNSHRREQHR
jgi:hypothetical protein